MISPSGHNLVFLLSTPRAGSTLLSVLLNRLPGVLCPPEPWFLLRLLALNQSGNPDAVFNDEFATLGTKDFLGSALPRDPIRAFAACAYNGKLSAAGKSLFVDKTPRYYHILPEIEALFPQAHFIWLQRNPLDVVASYKTTWNLTVRDLFAAPARPETLDFVSGLDALQDFFTTAGIRKIAVRYEDLAADPAKTLDRVQRFLGLKTAGPFDGEISRAMLAPFKGATVGDAKVHQTDCVHTASVDRWQSVLTPAEARLTLDTLGPAIFRTMGYAPVVAKFMAKGWKPPRESLARKRRQALRAQLPGRFQALSAKLAGLQVGFDEQTGYIATLVKERDRLAAENKTARQKSLRAAKTAQEHIDALTSQLNRFTVDNQKVIDRLRAQLDQLAATSTKQSSHISVLEKERDRLAAEAKSAKSETLRITASAQRNIDDLLSKGAQFSATALQQTSHIAALEKERDRLAGEANSAKAAATKAAATTQKNIDDLQAQLEQLATTARQQTDHIAALEKERDRLAGETNSAKAAATKAATTTQRNIDDLKAQLEQLATTARQQTDHIAALEKERDRLAGETNSAKAAATKAATTTQRNIDDLKTQLEQLATTTRQQANHLTALEKERDRFAGEIDAAKVGAVKAAMAAQKNIDDLQAQLEQLATTVRRQTDHIAALEKERERLAGETNSAKAAATKAATTTQRNIDDLKAQLEQLATTTRQQANHLTALEKERDRLATETHSTRADALRATTSAQKSIDDLLAKSAQISAIARQQTDHIAALEKERDRFAGEAKVAAAEATTATATAQQHIDDLLAKSAALSATVRQQTDHITALEKERLRIETERESLHQAIIHYTTTIAEQTAYIDLLKNQAPQRP